MHITVTKQFDSAIKKAQVHWFKLIHVVFLTKVIKVLTDTLKFSTWMITRNDQKYERYMHKKMKKKIVLR